MNDEHQGGQTVMQPEESTGSGNGHGPRYCINIENQEHPWHSATITTEDIIRLGGWDPGLGAVIVDQHNNERTLNPGEVLEVTPGHSFCRRVRFKRG